MKRLAIIPARSGSKELKDKNIKLLNGVPMLVYTIKAALESNIFDEVICSTDSKKYADIAKKFGASVPFLRSDRNSSDSSSSWDVVKEVLMNYNKLDKEFDVVCLLQPTSPLRTSINIVEAFELFDECDAESVISVSEVNHSPLWCNTLPDNNSLLNFIDKENQNRTRQQLSKYYMINGAIYIVRSKSILKNEFDLYSKDSYAYIMPKLNSIDVDNSLDFIFAETIIKNIDCDEY